MFPLSMDIRTIVKETKEVKKKIYKNNKVVDKKGTPEVYPRSRGTGGQSSITS